MLKIAEYYDKEVEEIADMDIIRYYEEDRDIQSYDCFMDDDWLEIEEYSYISPSGDELQMVAKYGRDG